jgi:hypothetical protein
VNCFDPMPKSSGGRPPTADASWVSSFRADNHERLVQVLKAERVDFESDTKMAGMTGRISQYIEAAHAGVL